MSLILIAPHWKIWVRVPVWQQFSLKLHDVGTRLKESRYFPWAKNSFPGKGLLVFWSSLLFPCFNYPGYFGSGSISHTYFHFNWDIIICIPWMQFLKKIYGLCTATHAQGKGYNYVERRWVQIGWNIVHSVNSRPAGGHGNGKMPIKTCVQSTNLGCERSQLGIMWEYLTLKHRGYDDGHPEFLFWRYVDADVKNDPSGGGTIWQTVLSPYLVSWPKLSSVYQSRYWLYRLDVWSWYIIKGPVSQKLIYSYMWIKTLA